MDFINKIELRGRVGSVKVNKIGDAMMANFSLCTETVAKDRNGNLIIDVTWFNIIAFEGKDISKDAISALKMNGAAHVKGRMRTRRYIGQDGRENVVQEVLASSIKLINKNQE